ncbi:hypothetical protein V8C35DRAFT_155759 [Trichoderma chlorosporum]
MMNPRRAGRLVLTPCSPGRGAGSPWRRFPSLMRSGLLANLTAIAFPSALPNPVSYKNQSFFLPLSPCVVLSTAETVFAVPAYQIFGPLYPYLYFSNLCCPRDKLNLFYFLFTQRHGISHRPAQGGPRARVGRPENLVSQASCGSRGWAIEVLRISRLCRSCGQMAECWLPRAAVSSGGFGTCEFCFGISWSRTEEGRGFSVSLSRTKERKGGMCIM